MKKKNRKKSEAKGGSKSGGAILLSAIKTGIKMMSAAGAVILSAAGAHAGYEAASEKHYFDIKSVEVRGNHLVSKESILDLVGPLDGKNILKQPLRLIGEKIEAHPWVKSVSIQRELPGALAIVVTERRPVVIIEASEAMWLIDDSGVVIEKAPVKQSYRLPVIRGMKIAGGLLSSGDVIDHALLAPAFMAINKLAGYRMLGEGKVSVVDVSQKTRLTISFTGSPTKIIAPKKNWTDEVSRLLTVDYLLRKKKKKAESIGLMFADKVIVTYKEM